MFWHLLNSAFTTLMLFFFPLCSSKFPSPPVSRLGVSNNWEEKRLGQPIWTHQRDILYQVTLSSESFRTFTVIMFVFPSNCYMYWDPALQDVANICLLMEGIVNSFCALFAHVAFASPLNCFYVNPWVFLPSFYFLFNPQEMEVNESFCGCVAAGWGQSTTAAL